MKLNYEYGENSLTITRSYEPGEKYLQAVRWDSKHGKATKEKVEAVVPGSRFVEVRHRKSLAPTLDNVTQTMVIVELTAGVEE